MGHACGHKTHPPVFTLQLPATVLYICMIPGTPSYQLKLAGIRRYCAARGWNVVAVDRADSTPGNLPSLLRRHSPVGCVVEGIGRHADLPPHLFRGIPVSYIGYPRRIIGSHPNFGFDPVAIAKAALRELSAGMPSCYAAIGFPTPWPWARNRVRAFRDAVRASGAKCLVFPAVPRSTGEDWDSFVGRLARWLVKIPEHCAVFAVSDEVAIHVVQAARLAGRHIPRSLTLVSVDNFTKLCECAETPISSIQLDFERLGFLAAGMLGVKGCDDEEIPLIGPLLTVRRKSTSGRGRHEPWIMDAIETIRREACNGLTASALIKRYPASKRLFTLRFREATGHSVLDEILHVRLEKACTLLARTDTAIGAIPGLCGFGCGRTLDALFRSRFGLSMSAWRRRNAR